MKKQLLTISFTLLLGASIFAQSSTRVTTPVSIANVVRPSHSNDRSTTCTSDTLNYAYLKEELLGASGYNAAYLQGPSEEESQAYISPGTVNVVGVSFQARVNSANAAAIIPTRVYLYTVDAAFKPVSRIDSAIVTVSTVTVKVYNANFTIPHSVTGNYAVVIKPTTAFRIDFLANNADVSPSYGEGLSYTKFDAGSGSQWYMNSDPINWAQDFDALISPVVTYTVASNYTMSPPATTMCLGTALTFTNTTTPSALLGNRMYSFNAFNAYWALEPDSTSAWDMGDGSPLMWSTNAMYTYPAAGTNNALLYTLAGFWNSCVDIKTTALTITPNAVSSFTQNATASPLIAFTSTSTGASTYSWNFGDGSALNTTANPSHTFGPGTWTVTLTVTSAGGCNTSVATQTVTVLATDIGNSSVGMLNVYPNPSTSGLFTIDMGGVTKTHVEVYNMMGELVFSREFTSAISSLDLSAISAGVYSMKVNANDRNLIKQIVIAK